MTGCFYYNKNEHTLSEAEFAPDEQFFGFCILKDFELLYKEDHHRFRKEPKVYALPDSPEPVKMYNGLSRFGLLKEKDPKNTDRDEKKRFAIYNKSIALLPNEEDAETYKDLHTSKKCYSTHFIRMLGCSEQIPEQYSFIGYDVVYPPACDGAFSLIFDCFFICKRYGCDSDGVEFLSEFEKLNKNGLFDTSDDAFDFMQHYLSFGWIKNAYCYIYEIYEKDNR